MMHRNANMSLPSKKQASKGLLLPSALVERRNALFVPSILATIFFFAIMKFIDVQFSNAQIPFGQVSLQFAFTEQRAKLMVVSLTDEQRLWAYASILVGRFFVTKVP